MSFLLYAMAFILLVVGLPALIVPKKFVKTIGGLVKNTDMVRMIALWNMFLAFFFLAVYPKVDGTWFMLIALLGWVSLIKSVVLLRRPEFAQKKFKRLMSTPMSSMIVGIVTILFSAFLVWAGLVKF